MSTRFKRISAKDVAGRRDYLIGLTARYYDGEGKGEPDGKWFGNGAKFLGLQGSVSMSALERMYGGQNPATGAELVKRRKDACPGYQMILAPSKPVSLLWALTPSAKERDRIDRGLMAAAERTLDRAQRELEYRLGKDGYRREQVAGILAALFRHGDSRQQDPHYHVHVEIANVAWTQDGRTVALSPARLLEIHHLLDGIYQRETAVELRRLGYAVEEVAFRRTDGKTVVQMGIAGIPPDLVNRFSKRGDEVDDAVAKMKAQGADITSAVHDGVSRRTKKAKQDVDRDSQFDRWQAEAEEAGFVLDSKALKRAAAREFEPKTDAEIVAALTDKESVFDRDDLEAAIARQAAYDPAADDDPDYVAKRTRALLRSPDLIALQGKDGKIRWTTKELRAMEEYVIAYAVKTAGDRRHAHMVSRDTLEGVIEAGKRAKMAKAAKAGIVWNEKAWAKQEDAVRLVVHESGRVAVMVGAAGAGKSSSCELAVQAFHAAGLKVIGASVSWKATRNFEAEAGAKSQSLASLVQAVKDGKSPIDGRTVVMIDEHGMAGSRDTAVIVRECERVGAKVVFIGEAEQLVPISSGAIFKATEEALRREGAVMNHGEGVAVLDTINRQRQAWHRDAVYAMRAGNAACAISAFAEHDRLTVADDKDAAKREAVARWLRARDIHGARGVLMLAATRAELRDLNDLARRALRERGEIGKVDYDVVITTGEQEGEKDSYAIREARQFSVGERVVFKKNDKRELGVINGDEGTIESLTKTAAGVRFTVKLDGGKTVEFDSADYSHVEWASASSIHAAQGKTVEEAVVLMDADCGLMNRNLAYVALSRSKGDTRIVTTTPADLAAVAAREAGKGTTLDYALAEGEREAVIDKFVAAALPPRQVEVQPVPSAPETTPPAAESPSDAQPAKPAPQMALWDAVLDKNVPGIKDALARGADIRAAHENGATVLHFAASVGWVEMVQACIRRKGTNLDAQDAEGRTALHFALGSGNAAAAQVLIDAGARTDIPDNDGDTAATIIKARPLPVPTVAATPTPTPTRGRSRDFELEL